ncbi:unnamed protein product [Clonostachys rosea f. rosea IK726]|uniref:Uncharacterized protein n=1 Tax=Clonostachys rosea f. rosea IK726 TaxID=1349383 RepID=A0ACA9TXE1_BIOOC|nr:unnamed protein product [Clonostachys rosea f. rosea IK726]
MEILRMWRMMKRKKKRKKKMIKEEEEGKGLGNTARKPCLLPGQYQGSVPEVSLEHEICRCHAG